MGRQPRSPERVAVDVAIRLALLALFAYFAVVLVRPFLPIAIWAVILTVALYPVFAWLRARLGGRDRLAAGLVTIAGLAVMFGPAAILTASLARTLERLVLYVEAGELSLASLPTTVTTLPLVRDWLNQAAGVAPGGSAVDLLEQYGERLMAPGAWLLAEVLAVAESFFVFAIAVVAAGFLLVSGPRLVGRVHDAALRVVGPRGSGFVELAGATIRNVARGVIGIAVLQSLLIGVGLIVAGVPHAGFFTLVALVLGILQLGTLPVLVPLIVWSWLTQEPLSALLFTLYMAPVGALETLLRPLVMGQGLETPMLVILVGVLGGTLAYGLPGLFIGPIILALLYDLVAFWLQDDGPASEPDRPT